MPKADWMAGLTGAGSGAATGAMFGAPGILAGGILGGVAGLFGGPKKPKKQKPKQLSTLDEKQQRLNSQQYEALRGRGPFGDLYNYNPDMANQVFNETIGRPAYRSFQEEVIPGITGAFRTQGLQNSSYVADALAKRGRDVQEGLNAQRSQYLYGQEQAAQQAKRQAIENLQNRQTFAWEMPQQPAPNAGAGGFDLNGILGSITPDMVSGIKNIFGGSGGNSASSSYGGMAVKSATLPYMR